MTRRAAPWGLALLLLAAACAPTAPAPEASAPAALTFPSELPPGAALSVARRTLRRGGWHVGEGAAGGAPGRAFTTGWRETGAAPLRLVVDAAERDGGASTVVTVRGEALVAGAAVPAVAPDRPGAPGAEAWATIAAVAQQVGAEVRYARP